MHKKSNEPVDTSKGYEISDLSIRQITIGVAGFFIFTAVAGLLGLGFIAFVGRMGEPKTDQYSSRRLPPEPNPILQNNITNHTDMWNLRSRENSVLETYGWTDRSKGIAHIPIEKAMEEEAARHGLGAPTNSIEGIMEKTTGTNGDTGENSRPTLRLAPPELLDPTTGSPSAGASGGHEVGNGGAPVGTVER